MLGRWHVAATKGNPQTVQMTKIRTQLRVASSSIENVTVSPKAAETLQATMESLGRTVQKMQQLPAKGESRAKASSACKGSHAEEKGVAGKASHGVTEKQGRGAREVSPGREERQGGTGRGWLGLEFIKEVRSSGMALRRKSRDGITGELGSGGDWEGLR